MCRNGRYLVIAECHLLQFLTCFQSFSALYNYWYRTKYIYIYHGGGYLILFLYYYCYYFFFHNCRIIVGLLLFIVTHSEFVYHTV